MTGTDLQARFAWAVAEPGTLAIRIGPDNEGLGRTTIGAAAALLHWATPGEALARLRQTLVLHSALLLLEAWPQVWRSDGLTTGVGCEEGQAKASAIGGGVNLRTIRKRLRIQARWKRFPSVPFCPTAPRCRFEPRAPVTPRVATQIQFVRLRGRGPRRSCRTTAYRFICERECSSVKFGSDIRVSITGVSEIRGATFAEAAADA